MYDSSSIDQDVGRRNEMSEHGMEVSVRTFEWVLDVQNPRAAECVRRIDGVERSIVRVNCRS